MNVWHVAERGYSKDKVKKENKIENRKISFYRSKRNLRWLINTNTKNTYGPNGEKCTFKFLTLTFKENIKDITQANYIFKKFIQRLSYYTYKKENILKYATVIEFQKRGAIHYHVIIFNMPYVSAIKISKIWNLKNRGSIHIKKIDDIKNAGSYICKYMSKNMDDSRLCGKKAYFTSRNLEKPEVFYVKKEITLIEKTLNKKYKLYETEFENKYCGKSKIVIYDLSKNKDLKKHALDFLQVKVLDYVYKDNKYN
jgi:hypothetical protein